MDEGCPDGVPRTRPRLTRRRDGQACDSPPPKGGEILMTDSPSAGRFVGREHELAVRVYYEDTDFTGVVYHANSLRFFERGRSDYLRLAGISHSDLLQRPDPGAFVITRITVD